MDNNVIKRKQECENGNGGHSQTTTMILDGRKELFHIIMRETWERFTIRRMFLTSCCSTFIASFFAPVLQGTVEKTFGGQMQFLTIIALFLTCATLLLNQFTNYTNVTYDLLVLSTVTETIVTVYYWSIFHYNRFWLYPKGMDPIPFVVDLFLHFLPAVALWLELLTTVKLHKLSRKHIYIIAGFSILYMFWAEYCYVQNGYYVYPVLSLLDYRGKVFLTVATICIATLIYVVSVQVHALYSGITQVKNMGTNVARFPQQSRQSNAEKRKKRAKIISIRTVSSSSGCR